MLVFFLLSAMLILFFSKNKKLKRYITYGFAGLALTALVILALTVQTDSKPTQGSDHAIVEKVMLVD